MSVRAVFEVGLAMVTVTVGLMSLCIVVLKTLRATVGERRRERRDAVRPAVLAILTSDVPVADLDRHGLAGIETAAFDAVLRSLLPKVRGADRVRMAAVLDASGTIERSIQNLASRSGPARQHAADLLGAAGDRRAVEPLCAVLRDPDPLVRAESARALGRIGDDAAIGALLDAVRAGSVSSNTAAMAIIRIQPVATAPLVAALDDSDPRVVSVVTDLCGTLGVASARHRLLALIDHHDLAVRVGAVRALGRLGDRDAVTTLLDRLVLGLVAPEGGDDPLSIAVITALGQIGDRRAIDLLIASLSRSHRVSFASAAALAPMGTRRSVSTSTPRTGAEERRSNAAARSSVLNDHWVRHHSVV